MTAEPLVPVTVEPSPIAGHGLVSSVVIPRGTAVLRFDEPPTSVADFRHVNHSCDPNLGWTDDRTLVALRDIGAAAELTTDYALALDTPGALVWCHCGTYRCRQVIEGDDWRIPQLQQRYVGAWSPRLAAHISSGR